MIRAIKEQLDPTQEFFNLTKEIWTQMIDWCLQNRSKHKFMMQVKKRNKFLPDNEVLFGSRMGNLGGSSSAKYINF